MNSLRCSGCGAARDASDNFCRNCGRQITVNLPAVPEQRLPEASSGLPPSLVGGVAALALGTGLEWLARRMASNAGRAMTRAAGKALVRRATGAAPGAPTSMAPSRSVALDSDVAVDEIVYIRQVRLKR